MSLDPQLFCYYHPMLPAASQCDVCGDYLCLRCAKEYGSKELCPACFSRMRDEPVNATVFVWQMQGLHVVAILSLLAPIAAAGLVFIAQEMAFLSAMGLCALLAVVSMLVFITQQPRGRLALSLFLTNLAGLGWYCLSLGWITAAFALLILCNGAGLVVGVDARMREEGYPLDRLCAIAAPLCWSLTILFAVLLLGCGF